MSSYYCMPRRIRLLDDSHGVVDLTSRTLHGRYLMPPGEKVNARILGVVGRAQRLYKIQLHAFIFMSNHKHRLARCHQRSRTLRRPMDDTVQLVRPYRPVSG